MSYVCKTQRGAGGDEGIAGCSLTDSAPGPGSNAFGFLLTAPVGLVGTNVDFVSGVKQSGNYIAYLFQN